MMDLGFCLLLITAAVGTERFVMRTVIIVTVGMASIKVSLCFCHEKRGERGRWI